MKAPHPTIAAVSFMLAACTGAADLEGRVTTADGAPLRGALIQIIHGRPTAGTAPGHGPPTLPIKPGFPASQVWTARANQPIVLTNSGPERVAVHFRFAANPAHVVTAPPVGSVGFQAPPTPERHAPVVGDDNHAYGYLWILDHPYHTLTDDYPSGGIKARYAPGESGCFHWPIPAHPTWRLCLLYSMAPENAAPKNRVLASGNFETISGVIVNDSD